MMVEAWEATLRPRRRSPAAMMAVARYNVEDTELGREGPATLVYYDAQAVALVRGGAEAMQHVARAEACIVMMKTQSSETGQTALAQQTAPPSMIQVLSTLVAAVVMRRVCGAADVSDTYTEAKRPDGELRYMRMLQEFTRCDAAGEPYVYAMPWNLWGKRAGGRNFERHKNGMLRERGYVKAWDALNAFTRTVAGDMVTLTNVIDDFLVMADAPAVGDVEANAKAALA